MTSTKYLRPLLCLWLGLAAAFAQTTPVFPFQIRASGSYIGVALVDVSSERAKELKMPDATGTEVVSVVEGAPAYLSGVRPNDVLLSYNGETVLGKEQLVRLVSETPPGRRVNMVCWRAGRKIPLSVTTAGTLPSSSGDMIFISSLHVTDVPSTTMIWRNLILGMESEAISDQLAHALGAKQGILVWTVAAASPAQHAGLQAGDVLTGFCGHSITSPREVGVTLQQVQANSTKLITINVIRDHKPLSLSIALNDVDH